MDRNYNEADDQQPCITLSVVVSKFWYKHHCLHYRYQDFDDSTYYSPIPSNEKNAVNST